MTIKSFKEIMTEKVELSKYREIYKQIDKKYREQYKTWFNNQWRIYLPLSGAVSDPLYQEVNNALSKGDYEIAEWNTGLAKSKKSTRTQRIGRLLTSLKEEGLLKRFNERHKGREVSKEKEEDLLVCISRHPYDIAAMSHDRQERGFKHNKSGTWLSVEDFVKKYKDQISDDGSGSHYLINGEHWDQSTKGWTSCKNLVDGSNNHYIPTEIDAGCLVAYVIRPTDKNIQKPLSRLLIIPLFNENDPDDTILYVGDKFYGKSITSFKTVVEDWLEEHQGETDISEYCLDTDKIYNDDYDELNRIGVARLTSALNENNWNVQEIDQHSCRAYTYNMDWLNDIFMNYSEKNENPNRVSKYFDGSIDTSVVDPESWEYDDNLRDIIKEMEDGNPTLVNKIIKKYKDAGGTEEDFDDIVDDLENELPDLTTDISNWYEEKKNEKWLEAIQEAYASALRDTGIFYLRNDNDRWKLIVAVDSEEYERLLYLLENEELGYIEENCDKIEQDVYDDIEEVNYFTFKDYLESILD